MILLTTKPSKSENSYSDSGAKFHAGHPWKIPIAIEMLKSCEEKMMITENAETS